MEENYLETGLINEEENTPLHLAMSENPNVERIRALLLKENILDEKELAYAINKKNNAGETALHKALKGTCQLEVIEYLLKAGASVNEGDNNDVTALHWAAKSLPEAIELLLLHGADPDVISRPLGRSPLDELIAEGQPSAEHIELLLRFGARTVLPAKIFENDQLNLSYVFLIAAVRLEEDREYVISPVNEKTPHCGLALTNISQLQTAKGLIEKILTQKLHRGEHEAAYKVLLNCLSMNWGQWLGVLNTENKKLLMELYYALKRMDENVGDIFSAFYKKIENKPEVFPLTRLIDLIETQENLTQELKVMLELLKLNKRGSLKDKILQIIAKDKVFEKTAVNAIAMKQKNQGVLKIAQVIPRELYELLEKYSKDITRSKIPINLTFSCIYHITKQMEDFIESLEEQGDPNEWLKFLDKQRKADERIRQNKTRKFNHVVIAICSVLSFFAFISFFVIGSLQNKDKQDAIMLPTATTYVCLATLFTVMLCASVLCRKQIERKPKKLLSSYNQKKLMVPFSRQSDTRLPALIKVLYSLLKFMDATNNCTDAIQALLLGLHEEQTLENALDKLKQILSHLIKLSESLLSEPRPCVQLSKNYISIAKGVHFFPQPLGEWKLTFAHKILGVSAKSDNEHVVLDLEEAYAMLNNRDASRGSI